MRDRRRFAVALGVSVIFISNLTVTHPFLRWLIQDSLASFGWFLVLAAAVLPPPQKGRMASLPSPVVWAGRNVARFLEAVGRRSYSLYLVHEMVLLAVMCAFRRQHIPLAFGAPVALALIWPATAPFYRFIELPSEWRSKQVGRPYRAPVLPAVPAPYRQVVFKYVSSKSDYRNREEA